MQSSQFLGQKPTLFFIKLGVLTVLTVVEYSMPTKPNSDRYGVWNEACPRSINPSNVKTIEPDVCLKTNQFLHDNEVAWLVL